MVTRGQPAWLQVAPASSRFDPVGKTSSVRHASTNSGLSRYHRANSAGDSARENAGRST